MEFRQITGALEPTDDKMAQHIIVLPDADAKPFMNGKGAARVICRINEGEEFACAINPRHGRYVLIASKALINKHKLRIGTPVNLQIKPDPANGLALPQELAEVMSQDEYGAQVFNSLNDGHKRGLIYYINQAKSVDTRIKRSLEIIEKMKIRKG